MSAQFDELGYLDPIRVLTAQQCRQFLRTVSGSSGPPPLDWEKGYAATSRAYYELAVHPTIVRVVREILGERVMVWGASIIKRAPDAVHPWHCDIESAGPTARTVAVWIGLEHTSRESALVLLPYSHRFGLSVQELRQQLGWGRDEISNDSILRVAQERDARSRLVSFAMTDGEALFFDGKLWHGSHNVYGKTRQALLLQYATTDTEIRIPDINYLDWPFRELNVPRPACIMVSGSAEPGVNRIVSAPVPASADSRLAQLTSRVYPLQIPLPPDEQARWKPYPIFRGASPELRDISCHASVLSQHHSPHPPHQHQAEEILLLLDGGVDLILPDDPAAGLDQRRRLRAGQLVYYPANFAHTLETVSAEPANYLMFRWQTDSVAPDSRLPFGQFEVFSPAQRGEVEDGFKTRRLFEGPTGQLGRLQCHASTLTAGAGYEPHVDAYDVAIVVLEGEVETIGERVGPHGVIFYPSGAPHGLRNPGEAIARYVVFEFQGSRSALTAALPKPPPSLLTKLRDPRRWKRKLKYLLGQIRERATGSA